MNKDKDINIGKEQQLGKIQSEIHTLTSNNSTLFEKLDKMTDKFDELVKSLHPKPLSIAMIMSVIVSLIVILGGMFATVIYIANSSNAPVMAQLSQVVSTVNQVNTNVVSNTSNIQLTNQLVAGVLSQTKVNADTLNWVLYDENLPKQIIINLKDIENIKTQIQSVTETLRNK